MIVHGKKCGFGSVVFGVGMCGNPKFNSVSVFRNPNRGRKVKSEVRVSVVFWKTDFKQPQFFPNVPLCFFNNGVIFMMMMMMLMKMMMITKL
jgi:hypothetical protein